MWKRGKSEELPARGRSRSQGLVVIPSQPRRQQLRFHANGEPSMFRFVSLQIPIINQDLEANMTHLARQNEGHCTS